MRNGSSCADFSCPYCDFVVSKTGLPNGTTRFNQINDAIKAVNEGTFNQHICVEEGEWSGFDNAGGLAFADNSKRFTMTSTDPTNQQVVENTKILTTENHEGCGAARFWGGYVGTIEGLSFKAMVILGCENCWDEERKRRHKVLMMELISQ